MKGLSLPLTDAGRKRRQHRFTAGAVVSQITLLPFSHFSVEVQTSKFALLNVDAVNAKAIKLQDTENACFLQTVSSNFPSKALHL